MTQTDQELEYVDHVVDENRYCVYCKDFKTKHVTLEDTTVTNRLVLHWVCQNCHKDDPDIVIVEQNNVILIPYQFYKLIYGEDQLKKILDSGVNKNNEQHGSTGNQ
jgi:hypothetical protein